MNGIMGLTADDIPNSEWLCAQCSAISTRPRPTSEKAGTQGDSTQEQITEKGKEQKEKKKDKIKKSGMANCKRPTSSCSIIDRGCQESNSRTIYRTSEIILYIVDRFNRLNACNSLSHTY